MTSPTASAPFAVLEPLESRQLMAVGPIIDEGAVRIETNMGRLTFLLSDATPITTENFLRYVRDGRYENVLFHRSVKNFVVQAGGFENDQAKSYPAVDTFPPILNEFAQAKAAAGGGKVNVRGTVSMAKQGGDPNSATSQFFVSVNDNSANLDNQNGGFTVFARTIGGSIHVADAINNLPVRNYTFFDPAFNEIPERSTFNFVVISSARAQRVLPITLDKGTRLVTWVDENGGETSISLNGGGRANLTFVGGTDMTVSQQGTRVFVRGNNVTLDEIVTRRTTNASVLAIKNVGGFGPSRIGDIVVTRGDLGRIDATSVQLRGDITAAENAISVINLQGTYRSTIATKGGSLDLAIKDAIETTITLDGGDLNSLRNQTWTDSVNFRSSITAKDINFLEVNGNFTSDLTATGNVNRVVINGNIGESGPSTWNINGSLRNVQVRRVAGLTVAAGKQINNFRATAVLPKFGDDRRTPSRFTAAYLDNFDVQTLNAVTISTRDGIGRINVAGSVDSSVIRTEGNIRSVAIGGSLTGNVVGAKAARTPSAIYAGVKTTHTSGPVTLASQFANKRSVISSLTVAGATSNTSIAAPVIGSVNLGTLRVVNQDNRFGVTADKRINQLSARTSTGKTIALGPVTTQAQIADYFSKNQITPAHLDDFRVRIV